MLKTNLLSLIATAILGLVLTAGQCMAQGCSSCTSGTTDSSIAYGSGCDDCGNTGHRGFRLGHDGDHPRLDEFKAKWRHHKALNARVAARNDAWPKPFDCADRQLYFSLWEPMIDQGFEEQCVLTSAHFDPVTHELNKFGQHTVAAIMQTMPSSRKKVFIHREGDTGVNEARHAKVSGTINTFYGQSGPANVAFSTKLPIAIRGAQADAITQLSIKAMQAPVIPISAGTSLESSIGN